MHTRDEVSYSFRMKAQFLQMSGDELKRKGKLEQAFASYQSAIAAMLQIPTAHLTYEDYDFLDGIFSINLSSWETVEEQNDNEWYERGLNKLLIGVEEAHRHPIFYDYLCEQYFNRLITTYCQQEDLQKALNICDIINKEMLLRLHILPNSDHYRRWLVRFYTQLGAAAIKKNYLNLAKDIFSAAINQIDDIENEVVDDYREKGILLLQMGTDIYGAQDDVQRELRAYQDAIAAFGDIQDQDDEIIRQLSVAYFNSSECYKQLEQKTKCAYSLDNSIRCLEYIPQAERTEEDNVDIVSSYLSLVELFSYRIDVMQRCATALSEAKEVLPLLDEQTFDQLLDFKSALYNHPDHTQTPHERAQLLQDFLALVSLNRGSKLRHAQVNFAYTWLASYFKAMQDDMTQKAQQLQAQCPHAAMLGKRASNVVNNSIFKTAKTEKIQTPHDQLAAKRLG